MLALGRREARLKQTMFGESPPLADQLPPMNEIDETPIGLARAAVSDVPLPADIPDGLPARYYRTIDARYWLLALAGGAVAWGLLLWYLIR